MARGEAAWAVTDSIKVLMDGPRTAQRPALTAVPCLRSCESRSVHLMAHMVHCATVSALSCGAPCVTDVVYCVALLGARAPSARPRWRPVARTTRKSKSRLKDGASQAWCAQKRVCCYVLAHCRSTSPT